MHFSTLLNPIMLPATAALISSVAAQLLYWTREAGILQPFAFALLLLLAMGVQFFLFVNYFGWKDAAIVAVAIAVGAGLGILSELPVLGG